MHTKEHVPPTILWAHKQIHITVEHWGALVNAPFLRHLTRRTSTPCWRCVARSRCRCQSTGGYTRLTPTTHGHTSTPCWRCVARSRCRHQSTQGAGTSRCLLLGWSALCPWSPHPPQSEKEQVDSMREWTVCVSGHECA